VDQTTFKTQEEWGPFVSTAADTPKPPGEPREQLRECT
jgi:hypothetical protein